MSKQAEEAARPLGVRAMSSDQIRESFLSFFEERGHLRIPSASLIPSEHDPSALLTVAGMHPLKPYFLGREQPPAPRLTDCQKCFRTVDIEHVGRTSRHLTFFEMLGNFSIGDYFKREAIAFALELSQEVFGFPTAAIWVTVFAGDEELGLGPDEEAIAIWEEAGIPAERIVRCGRSENFWQAGPTGPCGPCSELYLDRGAEHGSPDDLPGGENERFLEYWNLVFMQYDQSRPNVLAELPARNIDTGLGLNRLAAICQGKRSVFETDQFWPLIELGCELAGVRYGDAESSDRALRILADHSRAMTFLVADGVVPSNEERGYVLRRVMRRAIHQGRLLELAPGFLLAFAGRVRELMAGAYPELESEREAIELWLAAEEESFSRTLDQGLARLAELIERAREQGSERIPAEEAFRLHDTHGFPIELTRELLEGEGIAVAQERFAELMEAQRTRARAAAGGRAAAAAGESLRERARALAAAAGAPSEFVGYEREQAQTVIVAAAEADGADHRRWLLKLAESPFYPVGGGQVADRGVIECLEGDCQAVVEDVLRLGDDQVIAVSVERGTISPGERVRAQVARSARFATECNHTATHLLHAALRGKLGGHVRQAGSYVGPDKLRFDFSHMSALSEAQRQAIEEQVNAWIAADEPVSAITTTLAEAQRLGAMALFGEKYGEVVRMVQIGDGSYSRELCGGTHVRYTGEIGAFVIISESSSAANVRRIEALTGPAAVAHLRRRSATLQEAATLLRCKPEAVPAAVRKLREEHDRARRERRTETGTPDGVALDIAALRAGAKSIGSDGVRFLAAVVPAGASAKALIGPAEQLRSELGEAVVILASTLEGNPQLVVSVAPALADRGVSASDLVRGAAEVIGGRGGGRPTLAQGGGGEPERLGAALAGAQAQVEATLAAQ